MKQLYWARMFKRHWVEVGLDINPRDIWIGLRWKRYPQGIDLYFGLLPCVLLDIYIEWR